MKSIVIFIISCVIYEQLGNFAAGGDATVEPPRDYRRTVVFIQRQTEFKQDLFLRGGIDHNRRDGCTVDADTSPCAIPVKHRIDGSNAKFNAWKDGDDYLDWYGAEGDQGSFGGISAAGTPMVWTTNDEHYFANVSYHGYGYTELNVWGQHYWMVDLDVDCSKCDDGWFELKALLPGGGGWESDRNQDETCEGSAGGSKPYSTGNHLGRCGYLNKFSFNGNGCLIDNLE